MHRLLSIFGLWTIALVAAPSKAEQSCDSLQALYDKFNAEPPLAASELAYKEYSPEKPNAVILIHGLNGSRASWPRVTNALKDRYRVVTYDMRGHGQSADRGRRLTNATMAGDLDALMNRLNIASADIIGHSMGGRTAIKLAHLYPHRVKRLIIEDMHIRGEPVDISKSLATAAAMRKLPSTFADPLDALIAIHRVYDAQDAEWADLLFDNNLVQLPNGRFGFNFRLHVGELYESHAMYEDLSYSLATVTVPTLFLQADPSMKPVLGPDDAQQIRVVKPDAKIVVMKGSDHSIHKNALPAFLEIVGPFLQQP